jgi:hypothetical protein
MGDMVIVTLEGDDPAAAFGKFVHLKDPFTGPRYRSRPGGLRPDADIGA